MRILMTTDAAGGVWSYTRDLVKGILASGAEVFLVCFGPAPREEHQKLVCKLRRDHPRTFQFVSKAFPLEWMEANEPLEESANYLSELLTAYQPDLLHTNQYRYGSLECGIPKIVVAHSDVVSWWEARYGEPLPVREWYMRYVRIVTAGLQGADVVISPSKWQLDQLCRHYGHKADRGRVIANGAEPQHGAAHKSMQAVTAGRLWDEGKNIALLEEMPLPLMTYVAGECRPLAADPPHPVRGTTCYLGSLNHHLLLELLKKSAVYIAPSLYEPFGLAPLEAAQAGCALVLSDIESFHEVWGEDAIYFSARDAASLHSAVNRVSTDWEFCEEMGRRARERARRLYGVDRFVQSYLELYEELIEESRASHVA